MFSILYVSRSVLAPDELEGEIDRITQVSISRNSAAQVTGALLFTGERFSQLLEGPKPAVIEVMASIRRDWRHSDIVTIRRSPIEERSFADWSMAYSGPSTFAGKIVDRALAEFGQDAELASGNLMRLLQELARSPRHLGRSGS